MTPRKANSGVGRSDALDTNNSPLLTLSEAAQALNVHISTLRRWSNLGLITTYRIGPRGDRRFKMDDIQQILGKPARRETHP